MGRLKVGGGEPVSPDFKIRRDSGRQLLLLLGRAAGFGTFRGGLLPGGFLGFFGHNFIFFRGLTHLRHGSFSEGSPIMRSISEIVNGGREIIWAHRWPGPAAVASGVAPPGTSAQTFCAARILPRQSGVHALCRRAGCPAPRGDADAALHYAARRAQRSLAGAERGLAWRSSPVGRMTS